MPSVKTIWIQIQNLCIIVNDISIPEISTQYV